MLSIPTLSTTGHQMPTLNEAAVPHNGVTLEGEKVLSDNTVVTGDTKDSREGTKGIPIRRIIQ